MSLPASDLNKKPDYRTTMELGAVLPKTAEVKDDHLFIGGVDMVELAKQEGTALYVFDEADLRDRMQQYERAFHSRYENSDIVFASKAFCNKEVLRIVNREGLCLDVSGGGKVIAEFILNLFGGESASTAVLMAAGVIVTTILTNFMSNTALAAMMTPIYIEIALQLGISPIPFVIAIGAVATNLACATPVGTPACTQTLPAGYKYMDYVKIGGPLCIILMILAAVLAPIIYTF